MGENEYIAPVGNYGMELILLIIALAQQYFVQPINYSAELAPAARRWVFFLCSLMVKNIIGGIIMLSKRKEFRDEIYEICKKSGDVKINDHFTG